MDPNLWRLIEQGDSEDEVSAILRLAKPGIPPSGVRLVAEFGDIATVRLKRSSILDVRRSNEVVSEKAPIKLWPDEELEIEGTLEFSEETIPSDVRISSSVNATGRGICIGIVDYGLDIAHPEFCHPDGTTRIITLWDQRPPPNPKSPEPYRYGVVYDAKDINKALASKDPYTALGYHPADSDPDGRGAHGTCVTSIAAGNGRSGGPMGVASEAHIIFVHHSARDSLGVDKLGNSDTLLEAVHFIKRIAGNNPLVINLSMGRHGENHTGETTVEQAFDSLLRATPGCAICMSTGNYFNRSIHSAGQLNPEENQRTLIWEVSAFDVTPKELEIWYSSRDNMVVEVRSPDGMIVSRVGQNERALLGDPEKEIGYIFHRTYEPNTLNNHIKIFLNPGGVLGEWQVTIIGVDIVDGRFDAWIERDAACCQSRFHEADAVSTTTTGSICNGKRTIAVGAFDSHTPQWALAPFSSSGPTLTGLYKPDCVAPGVQVLAARSASRDRESNRPLLTRVSGTSFAAPHVTGCIALMFEVAGRPLHIEETHNLLLTNCDHVTETKENLYRLGRGYLNIERAVEAARKVNKLGPLLREAAMNTEEKAFIRLTSDQENITDIDVDDMNGYEVNPSEEIQMLSDQEFLDILDKPEILDNSETINDDSELGIISDREIAEENSEFAEIYGIRSVENESWLAGGEDLEETVSITPEDWFLTEAEIGAARGGGEGGRRNLAVFTSNNLVTPLIDGEEMMRALRDDLVATHKGNFIHFTAWRMDRDQSLVPSAKSGTSRKETVRNLWTSAIRRGVISRTLIYKAQGAFSRNASENSKTRDLFLQAGGEAILDARFPSFGSHHQKSAIIQCGKEAVSYCGGIDLAGDRWDTRMHNSNPRRIRESWHGWHDVHAKLRGPAVLDIEKNFRDRWNDTTWPSRIPPVRPPVRITTALPPVAASPGTHYVQVLRTYGCESDQYPTFAPRGEFTCLAGYRKAIGRATNYIYIEDQYLVFDEIAQDLANALNRIKKLVIVVPRDADGWPKEAFNWHQNNFLNLLRASHPGKVHIYNLVQPATKHPIYVHSKVMIIDDIYAVIGSTNFNRRSMTHDTEIAVAVIDASIEDGVCRFARDLRRNLWGEHLNIVESDQRLTDPIAAVSEWERQAKAGTNRVRHHTTQTPQDEKKFTWDKGSDPDGRCLKKGQVMLASDQGLLNISGESEQSYTEELENSKEEGIFLETGENQEAIYEFDISTASLKTAEPAEPEPTTQSSELGMKWETSDNVFKDTEIINEIEEQESTVEKRCKEQWLKWLATLPAPVQEASKRVKSINDQDPLMLRAIQYGIRDPDYLARLAFYSLGEYGYCPPKGLGLTSWRYLRLQANKLLKVPVPPATDVGPLSCSGRKENIRDKSQPDAPTDDISGRYYFFEDRKPYATVLINQAGRHITMRITRVLSAIYEQEYKERLYKEYIGDLQADGTFRFFNQDKLTEQGTIFRKDGLLHIRMERPKRTPGTELVRLESRPTLLAPTLDLARSVKQGPLGNVLERHELYPLVPAQIHRIREIVNKSFMDEVFRLFFQTSDKKIKDKVFKRMVEQVTKLKEFHSSDLPLVRLYAREELSFNKWTNSSRNVRRSHLDWIQIMTDWIRSEFKPTRYGAHGIYKDLADYLGIRLLSQDYEEKPPHTYEITLNLIGAGLLVGYYTGQIRIEKTSEPRWPKPVNFEIDLFGAVASIGLNVESGSSFKGIADSYLPWTPNDIPGMVRMFRGKADAGMGLVSAQMGFMDILGDGTLNPLVVYFQDANLGVPDPLKIGEEGIKEKGKVTPKGLIKPDLTVSALFGEIGGPFWRLKKFQLIDDSTPVVVQKVDIDVTGRQRAHFCYDSAILTSAGRDSLRQLCAEYLPLFLSPETQLVVVGHTDSKGTVGYNLSLSRNRADNTLQAIRDILGNKFQAKYLAIPMSELAARMGGKNKQLDPRFRRVDIFLNGHLVLTLRGPTAP